MPVPSLRRVLLVSLAAALAAAAPAAGPELPRGTWSGAMSAPGGQPIPVSFEVGGSGATITIVMSSAQVEGEIAFNDVRLAGNELTFWWEPGVRVDCVLGRTSAGGYEGTCSDGSAGDGTLSMVPPGA